MQSPGLPERNKEETVPSSMSDTNNLSIKSVTDEEYRRMLRDYAAISRRRSGAAVATALRHQAPLYRDILAFEATNDLFTYEDVKDEIQSGRDLRPSITSFVRFGELGRLVLLQDIYAEDSKIGEQILSLVVGWLSVKKARPYRMLLVQFHILSGRMKAAESLLAEDPELDADSHYHLQTDIKNPYVGGELADREVWLSRFNEPFRKYNLLPVHLNDSDAAPFSRLTCVVPHHRFPVLSQDKLVSVIFTSYRPQREDLINAVTSVLNQTWQNLEVIIVNDSSGPEYSALFEEVADISERIKVVTTPRNVGTYKARNLGFSLAQGEYLTGHDDDDWSHPQRLEVQVSYLETNPDLAGCRVYSIACDVNLLTTRLGKKTPEERNASTLMLSRETWTQVGGFLPVRKAGDTELYLRVERVTQKAVSDIPVPLTIIRKAAGSLSNAEFRTGWSHPARRSFKAIYNYWHQYSSLDDLRVEDHSPKSLSIPYRFQVDSHTERPRFDVIFAGDWHPLGGPQRSMLEEIKALLAVGKRIGIMHLEPARFMSTKERPLNDTILKLINSNKVTNVLYDDPVDTDLLMLRYPPIMQFPPAETSAVRIAKTIVVANQAPAELDGTDIRYIPLQVHEHTKKAFGEDVTWAPQSPMVRAELVDRLPSDVLEPYNLPGILNIADWYRDRTWFRSVIPVVGRHSRDTEMKWPSSAAELRAAYPDDGTFDIRILGGAKTPLKVLNKSTPPGNWTVYGKDQVSPNRFLKTLDFYVFFQHDRAVEAFGRAILEAVASGLVVILDKKFKPTFGDAAIYAEPSRVVDVVSAFFEDKNKYDQQITRSLKYAQEHFSYESYQRRIENLLKEAYETTL